MAGLWFDTFCESNLSQWKFVGALCCSAFYTCVLWKKLSVIINAWKKHFEVNSRKDRQNRSKIIWEHQAVKGPVMLTIGSVYCVSHCILYYVMYLTVPYTVLSCTMFCTVLYFALYFTVLYIVIYCTMFCTLLYCVLYLALQYTVFCTLLYCVLYFTAFYFCTMHFTVLCNIF